jgi:hypothetical protein
MAVKMEKSLRKEAFKNSRIFPLPTIMLAPIKIVLLSAVTFLVNTQNLPEKRVYSEK